MRKLIRSLACTRGECPGDRARPSHAWRRNCIPTKGVDHLAARVNQAKDVLFAAIVSTPNATVYAAAPGSPLSSLWDRRQFLTEMHSTSLRLRYLQAASALSWSRPAKRAR